MESCFIRNIRNDAASDVLQILTTYNSLIFIIIELRNFPRPDKHSHHHDEGGDDHNNDDSELISDNIFSNHPTATTT